MDAFQPWSRAPRAYSAREMKLSLECRPARVLIALIVAGTLTGCSSLLTEGSAAGAGVAGAGIAGALTKDASTTAAIGLGVNAAALAGVKALEKHIHADEQQTIASVAGALAPGATAFWSVRHRTRLEANEHGHVTTTRLIVAGDLSCKEAVFTIEREGAKPERLAYVTTVCFTGATWRWAAAEPATQRWGALQ